MVNQHSEKSKTVAKVDTDEWPLITSKCFQIKIWTKLLESWTNWSLARVSVSWYVGVCVVHMTRSEELSCMNEPKYSAYVH